MAELGKSKLRDAMAPLPYVWVISPQGLPKKAYYARNVNGGIVKMEDGEVDLRKGAAKKGWKLLQPLCSAEEWEIWTAYHAKADAASGRINALPKEHWPKAVANAAEPSSPPKAVFEVPKAKPKPKPKKDAEGGLAG